ncbi:MAG: amidohydrolase family protein, partial [Kangiellaceae bacterium]|nr:amidohydrolase family protein [Kangiellaceae bacterium]
KILSERPAQIMGVQNIKGAISVGYQADLVVWDPNDVADTEETQFQYPSLSPIKDMVLFGRVRRTYLRGKLVFHDG